MESSQYNYCFCTKDIDYKITLLTIINNYDKPQDEQFSQQFFSHIHCLTKRMDTTIRTYEKECNKENNTYECCFCESSINSNFINSELASLIIISNLEPTEPEQNIYQFYCHSPCFTTQLSYTATPCHVLNLEKIINQPKKTTMTYNNKNYARKTNINNTEYECCFCTKKIRGIVATLTAISNWEKSKDQRYAQQFFFHMSCFLDTLGRETRRYCIELEPQKIDSTL